MVWVYILKSQKTGRYYIGCANDVSKRLVQHNAGEVKSTKYFRPYDLLLTQSYKTLREGRAVEYKLKRLKRKDYIDKIIREKIIKMTA